MDTTHSTPEQPEGPQPGPDLPESQPSSGPDGHHPGPGTPGPPPASGKFFQWVRGLGVRRAPNRWMGGVCSGLADRWGIDPVIIRGLTVVPTAGSTPKRPAAATGPRV